MEHKCKGFFKSKEKEDTQMKTNLTIKNHSGRFGGITAGIIIAIAIFIALPLLVKPVKAEARTLMVSPAEVFAEVNEVRRSYGLGDLGYCEELTCCAQVRAAESSIYFEHARPDGSEWYSVNPNVQFGENLLWTSYDRTAEELLILWMNSPTHRALILDGGFVTMGVGNYIDADGISYWTIEFGY